MMRDRRMFARVPALVATLAVALLLLIVTYTVIASQVSSAGPELTAAAGSSSTTTWGGWMVVPTDTCRVFDHGLGGDPDSYAVEMWFLDTDDGWGLNRRYYGGLEESGKWYGVHWEDLTADTIRVCRGQDDNAADRIRIRIWIPSTTSDYASPWTDINPGETITFEHSLNITATDLTVGMWFSSTAKGIHNLGYGGLAIEGLMRMEGAHWHDLTDTSIQVTRHPTDSHVSQVRVIVVHGDSPHYDSLVDLGDWQDIAYGTNVFTHSLNWDPNFLLVRAECYSSTAGIHQWFAGGNHGWIVGWQGANLQNLTDETVEVYRQPDDQVCPQARIRIWKRNVQIYLPLVLNSYQGTE